MFPHSLDYQVIAASGPCDGDSHIDEVGSSSYLESHSRACCAKESQCCAKEAQCCAKGAHQGHHSTLISVTK